MSIHNRFILSKAFYFEITYNYILFEHLATRLSFKQPAYSAYESQKEIELQLYISKPRSTNVTVQVTDFAITATSKLRKYLAMCSI